MRHPSIARSGIDALELAFVDVAAADDLPEGELLGITLPNGAPVCVLNDRGSIHALGNLCTHAEFLMSDGVLHGDGTIECVWHGARFDCRSGAVRRHPASEPLPVYPVRVEGGRVLVGLVPDGRATTSEPSR